jgi:hypothetical protein
VGQAPRHFRNDGALLEVHDVVDITDFSQVTSVCRLWKEERKQEWAKIESDFVSAGPRPEKERLAVPADVKVVNHSVCSEEWLRFNEAHGGEDDDGRSARITSQQWSYTPLDCGHPLSVQQEVADNESEFSSENHDVHNEYDAETVTVKDDDLQE